MIVFSVITNTYDWIKPIARPLEGVRYILLTDKESHSNNVTHGELGWEVLDISCLNPPKKLNGVLLQRWAKIIGAIQYFKEDCIYIDGSYTIDGNITDLMRLCGENMALKLHPDRNCYIEESEACIRLNKANKVDIEAQISAYMLEGIPEQIGMYESGILIRRYNKEVLKFCNFWWNEVLRYTHRDQLSITKALYKTGIKFNAFPNSLLARYAVLHRHNRK